MRVVRVASLAVAGALLAASGLVAQNLTIGNTGPFQGNCLPFVCAGGGPIKYSQFQQIYAASSFGPVPINIFGLYFFNRNQGAQAGQLDGSTYQISLSTVPTTLAAFVAGQTPIPVGVNNTSIFSGALGGPLNIGIALHFSFAPFLYDPSQGNLLMNVNISNFTTVPPTPNDGMDADNSGSCALMARVWVDHFQGQTGGGAQCGGSLITGFDVSPVTPPTVTPEPVTMALVGLGLTGLAGFSRRRGRRRLTSPPASFPRGTAS